jgi:hypothetical protein
MKKLLAVLIIITTITATCMYMLPTTLKKASEKILSESLQTQVSVNDIDFSILKGTFSVKEITIKDYPEFSEGDIFKINDVLFTVDTKSLLSKVIVINKVWIKSIDLNLIGGIQQNNITQLKEMLTLKEQLEHQELDEHKNEPADVHAKHEHHHEHAELKLKIKELAIDNINLTAHIMQPIKLAKKELNITGLKTNDIGGENGLDINNILESVIEDINLVVETKIANLLPAQKVYEQANEILATGVQKSKDFVDEKFTKENLEKSKEKAKDILNKYIK